MKFHLLNDFTITSGEDNVGSLIGVMWLEEPLTEDQALQIKSLLTDCVATTLRMLNEAMDKLASDIYRK
jgi:hypothetical protein